MPNWNDVREEIRQTDSPCDLVRRKYLRTLHELTGRNVIAYYSGWLHASGGERADFGINDLDKIGLMSGCKDIDRSLGLDLILHTPGGLLSATESIIDYLHQMFTHIRVIVPQLAMSGGTMIACSAHEIVMGKQSSLGPIDPQFGGIPAHGIIEEFQQAAKDIRENPANRDLWLPIISKYEPTFIGECQKAIEWSEEIVRERLLSGMLAGNPNASSIADTIVQELGSHALTKSHDRHLSASRCIEIGLVVTRLEDDQELQDAILSVHHTYMHTIPTMRVAKIIENHKGVAFVASTQRDVRS